MKNVNLISLLDLELLFKWIRFKIYQCIIYFNIINIELLHRIDMNEVHIVLIILVSII